MTTQTEECFMGRHRECRPPEWIAIRKKRARKPHYKEAGPQPACDCVCHGGGSV